MSWPADQTLQPARARSTTQRTPGAEGFKGRGKGLDHLLAQGIAAGSRSRVRVAMWSAMSICSMAARGKWEPF
jgi:hypothetical protein